MKRFLPWTWCCQHSSWSWHSSRLSSLPWAKSPAKIFKFLIILLVLDYLTRCCSKENTINNTNYYDMVSLNLRSLALISLISLGMLPAQEETAWLIKTSEWSSLLFSSQICQKCKLFIKCTLLNAQKLKNLMFKIK